MNSPNKITMKQSYGRGKAPAKKPFKTYADIGNKGKPNFMASSSKVLPKSYFRNLK